MTKRLQVTVRPPLKVVSAKLKRRQKLLGNTAPAMKLASVFLDQWVQRNFKSEGGNVGGWVPFKAGGRAIKGGGFDSRAKLLQDTGRLRASFMPFYSKDNAGIGSFIPYSEVHEFGEGVPERRMLPKNAEVIVPIAAILKVHVKALTARRL